MMAVSDSATVGRGAESQGRTRNSRSSRLGELIESLGYVNAIKYLFMTKCWLKIVERRAKPQGQRKHYRLGAKCLPYPVVLRANSSDVNAFWGVICRRQYDVPELPAKANWILDCGANVGFASAFFLGRYPGARVIAVEPDSGNFEMLKRNTNRFHARTKLLKAGLWSATGDLRCLAAPVGDKGEWAVKVRSCAPGESADVRGIDIPSLIVQFNIDRVDILKIDIEGAELEIFSGNPDWLRIVNTLLVELHGPACRRAFAAAVTHFGFKLKTYGEVTVATRRSDYHG